MAFVSIDAATTEQGLRAYEQARAFERMGPRLPYWLAAAPLVLLGGAVVFGIHHSPKAAALCIIAAGFLIWSSTAHWKRLNIQYRENQALLARLEAKFGPDLPWLEIERHLAALRELAEDGNR